MGNNFRSEVFNLCKVLQKEKDAQQIGALIHNMSVVKSTDIGGMASNSRNDFAYLAKHSNTEFHGFLFLDDNLDTVNLPHFYKPEHMSSEERKLIERGHKTLTRFIKLCLSDIAAVSDEVANSMNPYFLYKTVNISECTTSLLTDDELLPAVVAFKNGATYKALMDANFVKLFNRIDSNSMRILVSVLEKEIGKSLGEDVSKDLKDFSMKLHSRVDNITDVMFAFSVLLLSLKMSLSLSCHILYRAICGIPLFVLNNDNIINIEKNISTVVSDFYKVFAQDIFSDFSGSEMGSILLLDCDLPGKTHVHEFGMLIAQTTNFDGEFGQSAKYSFVTINEEIIPVHRLVNEVLSVKLPKVQ